MRETRKIPLRKGNSAIFIQYSDGDFSNNLSCLDIPFYEDKVKYLELNFQEILNSRYRTNSLDDLENLLDKLDLIERIEFIDSRVNKRLNNKLKQNDKLTIKLIMDRIYKLEMKIIFEDNERFRLVK